MPKYLVIVESPAKTKKIESFLGSDYVVQASFGHIMDLDSKNLSIDVDNNFEPHYIVSPDKKKTVVNLQYHKSKTDEVIIASDLDREGEMIGYSISNILKLNNPKRIVFNQITKAALLDAVSKPTIINMNMVHSQQARRLLDRLMGYKISPILQTYLQGSLSAGRVQSIAVMIIVNKENEVKDSIQNIIDKPFFKSTSDFKFNNNNTSILISANLMKDKEQFKIESKEDAIEMLNKLNKKIICKVIDVVVNEVKRNPPPPHTTATLMQEASTKFGMGAKKCMEVAQKLYEGGHITYMRTDSTNLSKEVVGMIKTYVNDNYGDKYYQYRDYKSKDEHSQEAHECIRQTHMEEKLEGDNITNDMQRLYNIIYKSTVASFMTQAIFDVQTIDIDIMNSANNTILYKDTIYRAIYEELKFDGYLAVYNDKSDSESDNQDKDIHIVNIKGKLEIKKNTIIDFVEMNMNETFTTPVLHYNEAGLIKYLKKESIGRPSTYASIISKIIERQYVEIKNIDGIEKEVLYMSVNAKKYGSIKEKTKQVKIGSEKQKIVVTELGISVNSFLMEHFKPIMDIKFTAHLEDKLDKIAEGKIKWFNLLREYYDIFNPICEKLLADKPQKALGAAYSANDKCLGEHNDKMIYLTKSKFGWCVKSISKVEGSVDGKIKGKDESKTESYKFGSIGDMEPESVSLEDAIGFLEYPKDIGKIGSSTVVLNKGKFGFYFKIASKLVGIKDKEYDPTDKTDDELLELAKELNENSDSLASSNSYLIGKTKVFVKTGEHGPYIMVPHGSSGARKPTFISIPKGTDHTKLTATKIKELMDNHYKKEKQWTKK
jgi:DNA topoisomerase-1